MRCRPIFATVIRRIAAAFSTSVTGSRRRCRHFFPIHGPGSRETAGHRRSRDNPGPGACPEGGFSMYAYLRVVAGPEQGRVFNLVEGTTLSIGRGEKTDTRLATGPYAASIASCGAREAIS